MKKEVINLSDYQKKTEYNVVGSNALRLDLDEIKISSEKKKYFYDIRENDIEDIYRVFIEEGTSKDITRRVNDSQPYTETMIRTNNWEYNPFAEKEKEATKNIFKLGKNGFNLVIWISPDDGGNVYKEGRLNIEFPTFGTREWSLYGKHMPLFWNREDSVKLAKRLLENGGISLEEINNAEDLRCQPIGFKINDVDEWIEKCRQLIPEFGKVWNFIENGDDLEQQEKVKKAVIEAMIEADGDNYYFESLMLKNGFGINPEGGHGGSWGGSNSGSEVGIIVTVGVDGKIETHFGSTEGLKHCEACDCYYSGEKCPLCKND